MDKGTVLGHLVPIQHDADGIEYDNSTSGLTADNTQSAIDEIVSLGWFYNVDGGTPSSIYGGIAHLDGGTP